MVLIYGESNKNASVACRLYRHRYPDRPQPDRKTFTNLCSNLIRYGSFKKPTRQRVKTATNDNNAVLVLAAVNNNPQMSLRQISTQSNISITSCQRILKEHKFFPYKMHFVHHLRPEDYQRRMNFLAEFSALYEGNENFLKNILWSDESRFHNNGTVTKHNCRYWCQNNPRRFVRTGNQSVFSVNVWCGILNGYIVGPYLYHETLNGIRYERFLREELPGLLENIPHNREELWFQQDDAPPHNMNAVTNYLNNTFQVRWIGNQGPVSWPARSPDLSPLDFFLWGYLKNEVFAEQIEDMADLYNKIYACTSAIQRRTLLRACNQEMLRRYNLCIEVNGNNFEHFL